MGHSGILRSRFIRNVWNAIDHGKPNSIELVSYVNDNNKNGISDRWENFKYILDAVAPYFLIVVGVTAIAIEKHNPPVENRGAGLSEVGMLLAGGGLKGVNDAKKKG